MQRLRSIIYGGLLIAWAAFAIWQYRNYQQQSDLIVTSMRQQSRSIMTALVGGLRSHRRLGQFFEEQLQGMLDELVKTADVIFVAIRSTDNSIYLSAGDAEQASALRSMWMLTALLLPLGNALNVSGRASSC